MPHINTSIITYNSFLSEEEEEEINEDDLYCSCVEEFMKYTNRGVLESKYPWKDYEKTCIDCFLYHEEHNRPIKKKNAHITILRWIKGGDPKKMKQEEQAWIESKNRNKVSNIDFEEIEKIEHEKKVKIAKDWIAQNEHRSDELKKKAKEKALLISKGKDNIAETLSKGIYLKLAYEESMK